MKLKQVDWMHANDNNYSNTSRQYKFNPHTVRRMWNCSTSMGNTGPTTFSLIDSSTFYSVARRFFCAVVDGIYSYLMNWPASKYFEYIAFLGPDKFRLSSIDFDYDLKALQYHNNKNVIEIMGEYSPREWKHWFTYIKMYASIDFSGHYTVSFIAINKLKNVFGSKRYSHNDRGNK